MHLGVWHDATLLNEPQQQWVDSVELEFVVQRVEVEAPQLFRALDLNVEAPQEVVQVVWIRNDEAAVRALAVYLEALKRLQRLGANVRALGLPPIFLRVVVPARHVLLALLQLLTWVLLLRI